MVHRGGPLVVVRDDPEAYAARLAKTRYTNVCPTCGQPLAEWAGTKKD